MQGRNEKKSKKKIEEENNMAFLKKKVEEDAEPETKPIDKDSNVWEIGEVATATSPILINKNTGEQLEMIQALALILNKLERIEKFID